LTGTLPIVMVLSVLGRVPVVLAAHVSAASPERRASFGLAPDANGDIVLFGGDHIDPDGGVQTWFGDTWTWDGATWTQQHPESLPQPRCCFAMAFDSLRRQTVLFGGINDTNYFNDTWTWDGATWTEQHPQTVPPAQYGPGMAFDSRKGEMVMLSGCCASIGPPDGSTSPFKSLTWTWDGSNWTQQSPLKSPDYRERMGLTYDSARRQVVVFGGEYPSFEWQDYLNDTLSWVWTKWAWHNPEVKPTRRSMVGMAYDPSLRQVVMFGGNGWDDTTWLWDGQNWSRSQSDPLSSPRPRWAEGLAWDGIRRQIVMFGGRQYRSGYKDFGDTWIWDGVDWNCLLGCPP
jgi:hypothetical protein